MVSVIDVQDLTMVYKAPLREAGLRAALVSVVHRTYREIHAVENISFTVDSGEVVGFIGPNGAGKTTTLKMLSGILHPTRGEVRALGAIPWRREPAFLRQIALIRGSQPISGPGELTVLDSLRFQQLIYEVSDTDFKKSLAVLVEMLDLEQLLRRQIRALSLGERMRCGLALALIYQPRLLFLDEPTLGLDVTAIQMMRRFIATYSRETHATILLTSHYMADVETLCKRIVLIDKGRLQYDGRLEELAATLSSYKLLKVAISDELCPDWSGYGEVVETEDRKVALRVQRDQVAAVTTRLLAECTVIDLAIENPPLERVMDQVYREGIA
ncbi:ABC transporter [Dictyobacter vulcani]|uniref:ABC transporter n=1 Tax=Dictyobacter vulcani TaxID=2607529 RepID=A0A5J4KUK1_9CHLR|nr:ATP-binding cassette domain-containing protein [Dictyobacter vulcani]GER91585.1 ABC transporter [Dictyobacter vulcani]